MFKKTKWDTKIDRELENLFDKISNLYKNFFFFFLYEISMNDPAGCQQFKNALNNITHPAAKENQWYQQLMMIVNVVWLTSVIRIPLI